MRPVLSDFTGALPKGRGKDRPVLPDPGKPSDLVTGEPGRCAQAPPANGRRTQEPGIVRPAPEPPVFRTGSGSPDAGTVRPLVPITELSRRCGISRSTIQDWADAGVIVGARHPSARRKGLGWTEAEADGLIQCLESHYLIVRHKDQYRKTAVRPDAAFTGAVVDRFNQIWASESLARTESVQGDPRDSAGYRAIRLEEVEVWRSPDGSQAVRTAHPAEPEPVPRSQDIRQWRNVQPRPVAHTRAARRRWGGQ